MRPRIQPNNIILLLSCALSIIVSSCSTSKLVEKENDNFTLSLKKSNFSIRFPQNNFTLEKEIHRPDGKAGYFLFADIKAGLSISFMIEPAENCTDAKNCRDYALNKNQLTENQAVNLELSEFGEWALIEYLVPEISGIKINQQHFYANYVNDGVWVDLHLSKVSYIKSDRKLFLDFLKAISFNKKSKDN